MFACSMGLLTTADWMVWRPSLSRDRKWPRVTKCTRSPVLPPYVRNLEGAVLQYAIICIMSIKDVAGNRAGFSLSRALFRKKCVGPSPGTVIPIFPEKMATFFGHHYRFFSLHSGVAPLFLARCYVAKICRSSCGGPFLWGPMFGRTYWTCLNLPLAGKTVCAVFFVNCWGVIFCPSSSVKT